MSHFLEFDAAGFAVVEPTAEQPWESSTDYILMNEFGRWVERAEVADHIRLVPDRHKAPRNIDDFEFVPIIGDRPEEGSELIAGYRNTMPTDVGCDLRDGPFLDTNIAIGLSYRKMLIGLAAGALMRPDVLQIAQIQATVAKDLNPQELRRSGLFSGFYWRDTLVDAWIGLAQHLDIGAVEVQSSAQNIWAINTRGEDSVARIAQFAANYDAVAQRMGFVQQANGNWLLRLAESQDVA